MIAEARHLVDAPARSGRALAWHAGRWLLSLALALAPLWVGPWHAQQRHAGPPPLELSIVRLPAAAPRVASPVQPPAARPSPVRSADPAPTAADAPVEDAAAPPPTPLGEATARAVPAPPPAATQPSRPATATPARSQAPTAPRAEASPVPAAPAPPVEPDLPSAPQEAAPSAPAQPVDAEALDAGFRLLSRGPLTYPSRARRLSRGGEARVEVAVDPAGRVSGVTVLHETRGWGFGDAAREAYAQARFTPPTVGGRPVHVRWRKTLRFKP